MELNNQTAIDKNLQDILSANSAREEAEILEAIKAENDMPDISEIDNGYTNITRAFFSAAHATKDSDEVRISEYEKEQQEKDDYEMMQSLVQDLIQRNHEFQEEIYRGIEKNLDDARRQMRHCEKRLEKLQEEKTELLERKEVLDEAAEEAAVTAEVTTELLEEAKAEVAQAEQLQEACTADAAAADVCKVELGMEGASDKQMEDALQNGVEAAKANLEDVAVMAQVANDNQAEIQTEKAVVNAELAQVQKTETAVKQELGREQMKAMRLERKLESTKQQAAEFNQSLEADLNSGKITPEEAARRSAEFNEGLRSQASAADLTQSHSVLAANTDTPQSSRATASAASTLNDGGGIKAGSISSMFASAANGTTPADPALAPEQRQPLYATSGPAMAMG